MEETDADYFSEENEAIESLSDSVDRLDEQFQELDGDEILNY